MDLSRPKQLAAPVLLLLLQESPSHGYDLGRRMAAEGFCYSTTIGPIYRQLASLEKSGLIRSALEMSADVGPRRRVYELTPEGRCALARDMEAVASLSWYVQGMVRRYQGRRVIVRQPSWRCGTELERPHWHLVLTP